jgi:uncharacterized protein (TIGR01244 family)
MRIVKLSDSVAVSDQISVEDVAQIARDGFQVLVNNRPDGEVPGQPSSAEIAAAAEMAGLEYHYLPVTAMDFPGDGFEQMNELLGDDNRPVLAFCRSGTRCTNLWVASRDKAEITEAASRAQQLGYDLAMAARLLRVET